MKIEDLKSLMDDFDPAALLPELEELLGGLTQAVRIAVLAGPILILLFGLAYLLLAPKEANYIFGYRCVFGMGSVEAWQFTQRFAGITWAALGGILTIAMLIATRNFAHQDALEMLSVAARCVLWEAMVLLAASLIIRIVVAAIFDRHGERRTWKKSKATE